jgi:hypothetical protein
MKRRPAKCKMHNAKCNQCRVRKNGVKSAAFHPAVANIVVFAFCILHFEFFDYAAATLRAAAFSAAADRSIAVAV